MKIRRFYDNSRVFGNRSGKEITQSRGFAAVQSRNDRGGHSIVIVDDWDEAMQEGDKAIALFSELAKKKQIRKLKVYLATRGKQ